MTRGELHQLVDEIPDDQLASAAARLVELVEDDEPLSAEEIAALDESAADAAAGRTQPLAEVLSELGL